jgi:methylmalonyl-CoA mutase N-terminal domain/subunit
VEALTDEMEAAIVKRMDEIDGHGGMVKALEKGWVQQQIARRAYEWQRAVEAGEQPVVGVNVYQSPEGEQELQLQEPSPEAEARKAEQLRALRRERSQAAVEKALSALRREAEGQGNLMLLIREAVRAYATVGEIAGALKDVWGLYQPPTRF